MTTEEMILEILQRWDLPLDQQIQAFWAGAACVAPLMVVPIVIHYARRAKQGGGEP
jgi:hypothetical protein